MQGPNVRRLILHKTSLLMIPPGGTVGDAIAALTTKGKLAEMAREATRWVEAALAAVRAAPGSDQYPDDEAVAAAILSEIEVRKGDACLANASG